MAKQTGLHLIKGKVGEYSYYRSAGVDAPLMRRINQGMSARVKNGDEYANTRLNNAEFKNAQGLATFLFNAVPNRRASMTRRFAIAEMTKKGLEYIKDGSGQWGARIPVAAMDGIAVDLLENRAKTGPYSGEFGTLGEVTITEGTYGFSVSLDEISAQALIDKGIDGYYALSVKGALAEVVGVDGFIRQHFGVSSIGVEDINDIAAEEGASVNFVPSWQTLGLSPAGYTAAKAAANNGMFCILSFIPYRTIGNQRHTLFEYATFLCVNLGAIPE